MTDFIFLRPLWLLALCLLPLYLFLRRSNRKKAGAWQEVCDPALLPHLTKSAQKREGRFPVIAPFIGYLCAVIALSGPSWDKWPSPVHETNAPLVIALDMSLSMGVKDTPPSRLERAIFKIRDILAGRKGGKTALLLYSDEPFIIAPLSDDPRVIETALPSLSVAMMPGYGSRADHAISRAGQLLTDAGERKGLVLLLTDELPAPGQAMSAASSLAQKGHSLSVLAIGTKTGGPVPMPGRDAILKDSTGSPIIARMDSALLEELADLGGGNFSELTADDTDIDTAMAPLNRRLPTESEEKEGMTAPIRKDGGAYFLLGVLFFLPSLFRKNLLAAFLLFTFLSPAQADGLTDLFKNRDSRGFKQMQENKPSDAARLFKDSDWKGTAHFRAKDYDKAAKSFASKPTAENLYNLGNALAHQGDFKNAIDAYDAALKKDPSLEDAAHNKKILEEQQQQQGQSDDQNDQQQKKDRQGEQQKDQQSQDGQNNSEQEQDQEKQKEGDPDSKQDEPEESRQKDQAEQPDSQPPQDSDSEQNAADEETPDSPEKEKPLNPMLRKIPEDPSFYLREKMLRLYRKQGYPTGEEKHLW